MRLWNQRCALMCAASLLLAMPMAAEDEEAEAVEATEEVAEMTEEAVEATEEAAEATEEAIEATEEAVEATEEVAEATEEAAEATEEVAEPSIYAETGIYAVLAALYAIPVERGDLERANNRNLGADKTDLDNSFGYSGRLGYRVHERVAVEAEFDQVLNIELDSQTGGVERKTDVRVFHVTGNAKGYLATGRYQPFVMAGAGWGRSTSNPDGASSTRDDGFVGRVGGGIDIYGSRDVALTTELSYLFAPGLEDLDHLSIKAGLMLRFYGD